MLPRIALVFVACSLALLAAPAAAPFSPVGVASADCEIYLPGGGCTNACMIVVGVVQQADPKLHPNCPE